MTPLALFVTSFLIALTGALMPGPVLAVTIRESARKGFWTGPLIILGHAILELGLIALLLAGLAAQFNHPLFLSAIGLLGGCVLIWMGLSGWRQAGRGWEGAGNRSGSWDSRRERTVLAGILTSLSNPYWFLWWATIGLAYLGQARRFGWLGIVSFYGGHVLADLSWYSAVSFTVAGGKRAIGPVFYRWLLRGCALFLLGLGVYFIRSGILFLMGRFG